MELGDHVDREGGLHALPAIFNCLKCDDQSVMFDSREKLRVHMSNEHGVKKLDGIKRVTLRTQTSYMVEEAAEGFSTAVARLQNARKLQFLAQAAAAEKSRVEFKRSERKLLEASTRK